MSDAFQPTLQRRREQIWFEYTNYLDPQCHSPEYIEFISDLPSDPAG